MKRTVYRRRSLNVLVVLMAAFVALWMIVMLLQNAATDASTVWAALVAVIATYLAFRYTVHGVVADESGILIRNGLRTHAVTWDEIDHFELSRAGLWPSVGVAVLLNGRRIAMTSIQRAQFGSFASSSVERLNGQLNVLRTAPSTRK